MTHPHSTEALSLRIQALALLERAQALDGLRPFALHHAHDCGDSTYIVWSSREPEIDEASQMLDAEFEPDRGENLSIESSITLQEITGTVPSARVHDTIESVVDVAGGR